MQSKSTTKPWVGGHTVGSLVGWAIEDWCVCVFAPSPITHLNQIENGKMKGKQAILPDFECMLDWNASSTFQQ